MLHSLTTALRFLAAVAIWFAFSVPAAASHLVTGNGHGFAVVAPERGAATSFYPHPHSFIRPDPANPLGEGIETANFIKSLSWGAPERTASADYVDDSNVIRLRRADGSGTIFMPFGFERPALIMPSRAHRHGGSNGTIGLLHASPWARATHSCCGSTGSTSRCC